MVHGSSGSAPTLVTRDEITNHHLIAYSLSNICRHSVQHENNNIVDFVAYSGMLSRCYV